MKYYIFVILFINGISEAQDSLFMVNSLVGETTNRLVNAKTAGDLNGDGYADLAVIFDDSTHIYFGNNVFELESDYSISNILSFPGDINNDGYADFLFVKIKSGNAAIHVGLGGIQLDTTGILIYEQQYTDESFSIQVDPIGDVNGDGYNDFIIASPYNWSDGIGRVYLYYGGETINTDSVVIFTSDLTGDFFGHAATGIGDQNNDGYDDFLISAPNEIFVDSTISKVYLYYGSSEINSEEDSIFNYGNINGFGEVLSNAGDINADQHTDFFIRGTISAFLYLSLDSLIMIDMSEYGGGYVSIGAGGDINKDGLNDYLIGNTSYKNYEGIMVGLSNLYWGSETVDIVPDFFLRVKINGRNSQEYKT